jgi:hypothetical protein
MKFRDLQWSLAWEKFFIAVFEFIGQFFIQNDILKLQKVFIELATRVFLENEVSHFTDLRQTRGAKKVPKTILKTRLNTEVTTYTLIFVKYLVVSFQIHSIRAFTMFLEDSLKNLTQLTKIKQESKNLSN